MGVVAKLEVYEVLFFSMFVFFYIYEIIKKKILIMQHITKAFTTDYLLFQDLNTA